jgi:predicted O-methyltransferase YrrM
VALDVEYGNITLEEAERLAGGSREDHEPGSTEPWISDLVGMLVVARGARRVLETGSFMGRTSKVIASMLDFLGGGELTIMEIDQDRARLTRRQLEAYPNVKVRLLIGNALVSIPHLADPIDVAFVDDNHEKKHVERELCLLLPKMAPGGLILLHDVFGVCDLRTVVQKFGGYSIDLPRLGPAGGLGIIQI